MTGRNYSSHTFENYRIDLRLFFAEAGQSPQQVSWRDVDGFIGQQNRQGRAATTINRRLNAIKRFYDYLAEERERPAINPVKPSHFLRLGRPLPKKLTREQVRNQFAKIDNLMDRALFLLMLRCGLRVAEATRLKVGDIDWEQKPLLVEQ